MVVPGGGGTLQCREAVRYVVYGLANQDTLCMGTSRSWTGHYTANGLQDASTLQVTHAVWLGSFRTGVCGQLLGLPWQGKGAACWHLGLMVHVNMLAADAWASCQEQRYAGVGTSHAYVPCTTTPFGAPVVLVCRSDLLRS